MEAEFSKRPHPGSVVLDIGDGTGALIVYTRSEFKGREIEVSQTGTTGKRVHTDVLERRINNQPIFAAVFASLAEGVYKIWECDPRARDLVRIVSGEVVEVDLR